MFYGRLEFSDWSEVKYPRPFIGVYRQEVIPQHYALGPILLTSLTLFTSHIQSSVRMSTYLHTAVWQITIYLRGGATLLFKITKINQKYIHLCILSCGAQFNAKKVFYDSTHSACFISFDDFRCLTQSLNIWQLLLMQTDHDTDTGLFRQLICVNLLHKVWRI